MNTYTIYFWHKRQKNRGFEFKIEAQNEPEARRKAVQELLLSGECVRNYRKAEVQACLPLEEAA